jgi:hypothetical protein
MGINADALGALVPITEPLCVWGVKKDTTVMVGGKVSPKGTRKSPWDRICQDQLAQV